MAKAKTKNSAGQATTAAPKFQAAQAKATKNGVTKTDAVKDALSELGKKAMPAAIRDHVQNKFGMDLPLSLISNYKHLYTKKAGKSLGGKTSAPKAQIVQGAAKQEPKATTAVGFSLSDIESVKQLAQRVGATELHRLIDMLTK